MTTTERIDAAIDTMPKIEEFDGRFANAVKLRDDVMFWYGENKETILEALRFQKAMQWQPIDTAPKDGRAFVARQDERGRSFTCYWQDYHPESINGRLFILGEGKRGEFYSCWESDRRDTAMSVKPTHWMPVPTAELAKQVKDTER